MGERSLHILVISVVSLLGLGIVMLLSTSVFVADSDDVYHDVNRQAIWMVIGVGACIACALIDYRLWLKWRWAIFGVACVLLALCYVREVGVWRNGARRWLGIGPFTFQPSELAKLAVLFVLAVWVAKAKDRMGEVLHGFFYPLLICLVPIGLIAFETDMGTSILLATVVIALLFVAGCRWWLIAGGAFGAMATLAVAVWHNPNRMERVMAFLDLEKYKEGLGAQQYRGLMALGEGGLFGLGLGEGREKLMHLPFAHTDFIFPMIGEELGAVGSLAVVLAFALLLFSGLAIARSAPDAAGKLLGFGIVITITLQAVLNIGVTTAVLPNKGLPLPFISYGGSNLLFCLAGIGILLNIYRQGQAPEDDGMGALFRRCRSLGRV